MAKTLQEEDMPPETAITDDKDRIHPKMKEKLLNPINVNCNSALRLNGITSSPRSQINLQSPSVLMLPDISQYKTSKEDYKIDLPRKMGIIDGKLLEMEYRSPRFQHTDGELSLPQTRLAEASPLSLMMDSRVVTPDKKHNIGHRKNSSNLQHQPGP